MGGGEGKGKSLRDWPRDDAEIPLERVLCIAFPGCAEDYGCCFLKSWWRLLFYLPPSRQFVALFFASLLRLFLPKSQKVMMERRRGISQLIRGQARFGGLGDDSIKRLSLSWPQKEEEGENLSKDTPRKKQAAFKNPICRLLYAKKAFIKVSSVCVFTQQRRQSAVPGIPALSLSLLKRRRDQSRPPSYPAFSSDIQIRSHISQSH